MRGAHGHALRYSAGGPSPLWQTGHQYAIRAASPSGQERIGLAAARAGMLLAPVDAVPRRRAVEPSAHQSRGRFERCVKLVVGRRRRA